MGSMTNTPSNTPSSSPDNSPYRPLLRSQADVQEMWSTLMRPLGWRRPALWFALVDEDDRPLPVLNEVDELPPDLDEEMVAHLAVVLRAVLDEFAPTGRVALLYCRPGRGGLRPEDHRIAAALYAGCRAGGVPLEVVHLATDDLVRPLPLDEVGIRSA